MKQDNSWKDYNDHSSLVWAVTMHDSMLTEFFLFLGRRETDEQALVQVTGTLSSLCVHMSFFCPERESTFWTVPRDYRKEHLEVKGNESSKVKLEETNRTRESDFISIRNTFNIIRMEKRKESKLP